ncbi:hypothetical protein [Actinomycetospora termitidis]|uniref:Uncharacterized protein n=1 Tax=Actinomycetospora termitidis TaxID=3053470 RepID=A0ABT7MFF5_9PSEU|nr:hypothetical protein [Actinomycetospora sp. Odt1-22]MDL5159394.1 hypothetical protein [Actinomycetospora sp. Odt1-22]
MPLLAADVRAACVSKPLAPRLLLGMAVFDGLHGALLLLGGEGGVSSPSFRAIRAYGGFELWGWGSLAIGVALLAAAATSRTAVWLVATVGTVAWALYVAGFVAALLEPSGPPLPAPPGGVAPSPALVGPLVTALPTAGHLLVATYFHHLWRE